MSGDLGGSGARTVPVRATLESLHGEQADARRTTIIAVLGEAFGELARRDPAAFDIKFRKMAASPFAFYRGSACLFYADVSALEDPFLDERTSRIWIHGDLHAENFGTYMNADGRVVFDINDFDEAYIGPFTWDLRRFAASLALLGYQKALSDTQIRRLVETYAQAYLDQVALFLAADSDHDYAVTTQTAEGPLKAVLQQARLRTRHDALERSTAVVDGERRFIVGGDVRALEGAEREAVLEAYERYLSTVPDPARLAGRQVRDVVARRGVGIGSAGLASYNLLVEGHTEALEHDVILFMKQAQPATPERFAQADIRRHFEHDGHRTVLSQRALQAHADPWLGYTTIEGRGQLVAEVSPYNLDLDWDGLNLLDEILATVRCLGRATAKIHCISDDHAESGLVPFSTEEAITTSLAGREGELVRELAGFADSYGCRARDDHRLFVDAYRNGELGELS